MTREVHALSLVGFAFMPAELVWVLRKSVVCVETEV